MTVSTRAEQTHNDHAPGKRVAPECVVMGSDLRVGDIIKVWWEPGRDVIAELTPYVGLLKVWDVDGGAQIASFEVSQLEMTIEPRIGYVRIGSIAPKPFGK